MHRDLERAAKPDERECGQTMVEYTVVLSVITIGIMAAVVAIGDGAGGLVQQVVDILT